MSQRISLPSQFAGEPFTFGSARAAGVGEGRLRGPDLGRPFYGVRQPNPSVVDVERLCRAFAARMPAGCFFNALTAAQLLGIPLPYRAQDGALIHVAVVSPRRGLAARGVVGHKVQLMGGDIWTRGGLRISAPERTWCELGSLLTLPELVAAGDFLIHWRSPLCTIDVLADAVDRYPNPRGKPRLRAGLELLDDRAESPKESELRVLLQLGGIQGLASNYPVRVGSRLYRLDLAIPTRKVAFEYQGDYHRDAAQWRADMTRISILESAGWVVIQINADDLKDPRELLERIRRVLKTRPYFP
jgi:very-short-patch-repair endonuclease